MDPGAATEADDGELLTVDQLHQFAYCPRRMHLMYVDGLWQDNAHTEQGRRTHRRVDHLDHALPDAQPAEGDAPSEIEGDDPPVISRSVPLSSPSLGLTGKLDVVESGGREAAPVETKPGRVPRNAERSWEPERVQLMAQGLLLRDAGYEAAHGFLYFAGSRSRVEIAFSAELEARTRELLASAREALRARAMPAPLHDSPKCGGCSLAGICLPDETNALAVVPRDPEAPEIRRLYPMRDDATPLYVVSQGAVVGKESRTLHVTLRGERTATARLADVSQLVLCGNVMATAQAIHVCCEAGVPIVHLTMGGWFHGVTSGITLRNAFDRAAQFATAAQADRCLGLARAFVTAKITNQRTLLRRNASGSPGADLEALARSARSASSVSDLPSLLGQEGNAARIYFANFGRLLRAEGVDFVFEGRNRRPPIDPVNALLSFGYALLAKECTVALLGVGLDPYWGVYHQPRHGRPGLALDLMEEFRPLIVDSAVITALNTGMVRATDFRRTRSACLLTDKGRAAFIRAYEARLQQLATHPEFDYRCSWRQLVHLQARLLGRAFRGDVPDYRGMTTR